MDAVQPPIVPVIGAMIAQTPGTISLGQGVVHYPPPSEAADAVRAALLKTRVHEYQDGAGLPELRRRIARKLRLENDIDVERGSRIMVTAGANMAFMHAVLAVTEPGDEVLMPVPFYFNHEMAIEMAGCHAVKVPTDPQYQLRLDAIASAITDRTRAIVTVSPNNPSGAVLTPSSLEALSQLCRDRGLYHISDEPYEYFLYDGVRHVSPGSFPDAAGHTISIYSLSKAYGFAGWRIGYMAYPSHLEAALLKVQDTILICPTVAAQEAAIAALDVGRAYSAPHVQELAVVRELVTQSLATLGSRVTVPTAAGAFYCLIRIDDTAFTQAAARRGGRLTPLDVAEMLIREHKVAVIPGTAFGMDDGCYFRVAYGALQRDTVAEGVGRLVDGLATIFG
jgi:aspartate/methionine/tyrosine aminotransferase